MSTRGLKWGQRGRSDGCWNTHCSWSSVPCYASKWDTKGFLPTTVWHVEIFFLAISFNNQQFCDPWLPNYKRISPYRQPRNQFYSRYQLGIDCLVHLCHDNVNVDADPKIEDSVSQHCLHTICQSQTTSCHLCLINATVSTVPSLICENSFQN